MAQVSVSESRGVVLAIVERVAEREDTSIDDVPPLQDHIDCDSLRIVVRGDGFHRISFHYAGYTVTVESDATISVVEE